MLPDYDYIYKKNASKSLDQLKQKKRYLKNKIESLSSSDSLEINTDKETLYKVTLEIVNELIEKK